MKRYPVYSAIALVLLAGACTKNLFPDIHQPEGDGIVLRLNTLDPVLTKAGKDGVKDGEDPYNENALGANVDLFFFASSADATTPAILSLSAPVNASTHQVNIPTSTPELRTLFGGHTTAGSTCKVFVIANYNGTVQINHDRAQGYTRAELDALVLAPATWKTVEPASNPNFVMTGEATLTLSGLDVTPPVSGTVDMARVASKVTFSVSVKDEITVEIFEVDKDGNRIQKKDDQGNPVVDEDGNPVYEKKEVVMRPHKDAMTVQLCFANSYGLLSGEPYASPVGATADANLFDYEYRHFTETSDDIYGTDPFYSYPQTWQPGAALQPYIKIIIPWERTGEHATSKNYYYKVPLPELMLKRNNWYQINLNISILGGEEHTPLPVKLDYCVAPWNDPTPSDASVVTARYLSLSKTAFKMYNTETLSIPYVTSHDCEIVSATWSRKYYGSRTGVATSGDASAWISLVKDAGENNLIRLDHALRNEVNEQMDVTPYTITFRIRHKDADGRDVYYRDITVEQYPGIYINQTDGGNVFVDGYYTWIPSGAANKPEATAQPGRYTDHWYHYTGNGQNGARDVPYGRLAESVPGGSRLENNTEVNVTAFTSEYHSYTIVDSPPKDYIIGDPRVPFSGTLTNYLDTDGQTKSWNNYYSSMKMASTDPNDANIIAPSFIISSDWGRQGYGDIDFEAAQKRCATYQEAGYPAGRWRLPTEAEVVFVYKLQQLQFIKRTFNTDNNTPYWIASDQTIRSSGGNNIEVGRVNDGTLRSVRCVYDSWYWGNDPVADPTYQYLVKPGE